MTTSTRVGTMAAAGGGIGLVTPLTILFVALKLTHTIAWSWVWVLSPLWIGAGLWVLSIIVFIFLVSEFMKD